MRDGCLRLGKSEIMTSVSRIFAAGKRKLSEQIQTIPHCENLISFFLLLGAQQEPLRRFKGGDADMI
jgi:hypothetical protein